MLSKKAQESLLKALKVPDTQIAELLKDGDVEFDVPKLNIMTDDEFETVKSRVKNDEKTIQAKAQAEILGKKLNEEYGLGLPDSEAKDHGKVIEAFKGKFLKDAKIPEADKVIALQKDLETVRAQVTEKENLAKQFEGQLKEIKVNDAYRSLLPANRNKFLTDEEHINRLKGKVKFDDNGNALDPKTNEPFKDKMAVPLAAKAVIEDIYNTNEGWLHPEIPAAGQSRTFGTPGITGKGGKAAVDSVKLIDDAASRFDRTTPEGRKQFNDYVRTTQLEAAAK